MPVRRPLPARMGPSDGFMMGAVLAAERLQKAPACDNRCELEGTGLPLESKRRTGLCRNIAQGSLTTPSGWGGAVHYRRHGSRAARQSRIVDGGHDLASHGKPTYLARIWPGAGSRQVPRADTAHGIPGTSTSCPLPCHLPPFALPATPPSTLSAGTTDSVGTSMLSTPMSM